MKRIAPVQGLTLFLLIGLVPPVYTNNQLIAQNKALAETVIRIFSHAEADLNVCNNCAMTPDQCHQDVAIIQAQLT